MVRSNSRNIFKRFWAINTHTLCEGVKIVNPSEVICFPIMKQFMTRPADSFLQFSQTTGTRTMMETMQALLYATSKMREIALEKDKTLSHLPEVYIETLLTEEGNEDLGYRLWIFVMDKAVNMGEAIERMIMETQAVEAKYNGASSISTGKSKASTTLPGQGSWKDNLMNHEQYRKIPSKHAWAVMNCDYFIGVSRMAAQIKSIESSSLGESNNPANPKNVFYPTSSFVHNFMPSNMCEDQSTISNYVTRDGGAVWGFPDSMQDGHKRVLRVPYGDCSPHIFCYRFLPEYQKKSMGHVLQDLFDNNVDLQEKWKAYSSGGTGDSDDDYANEPTDEGPRARENQEASRMDDIHNEPVENETKFDSRSLLDTHIDSLADFLQKRMNFYQYLNDYRVLNKSLENQWKTLRDIRVHSEYTKRYAEIEEEAFNSFNTRCWTDQSDVSEISHIIREWSKTDKVRNYRCKHIKFDTELSVFASMIMRKMYNYDDLIFVANAHKPLLVMSYMRLDAYRDSNDLHCNGMCTGEGGTSKSFVFTVLEKSCIPSTVEVIQYETMRANAIDEDKNDVITIMHEIPPDMADKMTITAAAFKERLTSLKVRVKTFYFDPESGERKNRVTESECIGVYFGATNDDFSKYDHALITRFTPFYFTEYNREGKDISSAMFASQLLADLDKEKAKDFLFEQQIEQYRYFLVEKHIMSSCLPQFNDGPSQVYFGKFLSNLHEDNPKAHNRTYSRMIIMTRILSICYGLECLFNIPTGKHYGKIFEMSHLKDMKPFLRPTLEILNFVCGLFADELVDPMEDDMLKALKSLHDQNREGPRYRQIPSQTEDEPPSNYVHHEQDSYQGSMLSRKDDDYNYIAYKGTITKLAEDIYRVMENETVRPSRNQIKAYISSLKQRTIKTRDFCKIDENGILNKKMPNPIRDEKSPVKQCPAMMTDSFTLYLHFALISDISEASQDQKKKRDKIEKYICKMQYDMTIPQKIIHGITIDRHPQLFKTIDMCPKKNKRFIVVNALTITECEKTVLYNDNHENMINCKREDRPLDVCNVDFDTEILRHHFDKICILGSPDDFASYHPAMIDARENTWLLKTHGETIDPKDGTPKIRYTFSYPSDFLSQHDKKKGKMSEIMRLSKEEFELQMAPYMSSNKKRSRGFEDLEECIPHVEVMKKMVKRHKGLFLDTDVLAPPLPQESENAAEEGGTDEDETEDRVLREIEPVTGETSDNENDGHPIDSNDDESSSTPSEVSQEIEDPDGDKSLSLWQEEEATVTEDNSLKRKNMGMKLSEIVRQQKIEGKNKKQRTPKKGSTAVANV